MSNTLQQATAGLAHCFSSYGTGLRRNQSADGTWLPAQLERGRRIAEVLSLAGNSAEGYAAVKAAVGINPRQARTYRKLWEQRRALGLIWATTPSSELPRTMEAALARARGAKP